MRRGLKKAGFWKLKVFQGPPQDGPLSPLLANSYLNEYGQEMARAPDMRRGLKKAGFWKLKVFQGPPQDGPLSPLLANSYLDRKSVV